MTHRYLPAEEAPRDGVVFMARVATTEGDASARDVPVYWQSGAFHFVRDEDWFISPRPAFCLWRPMGDFGR